MAEPTTYFPNEYTAGALLSLLSNSLGGYQGISAAQGTPTHKLQITIAPSAVTWALLPDGGFFTATQLRAVPAAGLLVDSPFPSASPAYTDGTYYLWLGRTVDRLPTFYIAAAATSDGDLKCGTVTVASHVVSNYAAVTAGLGGF